MAYDRKVEIEYANREWSVYVKNTYDLNTTNKDCAHCGAKAEDDYDGVHALMSVEIVEMYDENYVDASKNSRAFRYAKKRLKAGRKFWPVCTECRNR